MKKSLKKVKRDVRRNNISNKYEAFQSNTKGRVFFIHIAGREVYKVNNKIKREYDSNEVSKKE